MNFVKCDERLDDLQIHYNGRNLKIIQNPNWFCYGMDAVLLANYARIKKEDNVLDLCSGSGIIPLIIAGKTNAKKIVGVEIMSDVSDMAKRSVSFNELNDRVEILNTDLKVFKTDKAFDVVTCNPPYKEYFGGLISDNEKQAISRTEIKCNFDDVCKCVSSVLKFGGNAYFIHRAERLVDICNSLRKFSLEPKRLRFVHSNFNKAPSMILIEAKKNSKPKLIVEKPLFIYDLNGNYTDELLEIYS